MKLERLALYAALLVAWVAMLGSLYFSEVRHFVPCTWCWYQRILMYPLALVVLPVGLLRRDEGLPLYALPFALLGMVASTYHYLLQKTTWFSSSTACQAGVPCNSQYINWFGFVTIPFLALTAFTLIVFALVIVLSARTPVWQPAPRRVWLPVVAVVGAVLLAFLPSFLRAEPLSATQSDAPPAGSLFEPSGATLYAENCAACHGPDATGIAGLSGPLLESEMVQRGTEAEWLALIRTGLPADDPRNRSGVPMPPSAGRPELTDSALLTILRHLEAERGK